MAYSLTSPYVGASPIDTVDTTRRMPLGTIVRAVDPVYGEGEFIYLKGVANTAVGSPVVYKTSSYQTALAPVGSNKPEPVAFAMAAVGADEFGFYQISGYARAVKTSGLALASNAAVGVATAGKIAATASGKEIQGAITVAKSTASTVVTLAINRPHMQGRVT